MMWIIHELRKTSSRNKKIEILKKYDVYEWKNFLFHVYNPYINYYIRSVNDNTFLDYDQCSKINYVEFYQDLAKLSNREVTGNEARDWAVRCSRRYGALFRIILDGSLKSGVTETTINKVYPGLIPTFDIMKGRDSAIKKFPVYVSTKFDGLRLLAFVNDLEVTLRTSGGLALDLESLKATMRMLPNGVYDGELVHGNGKLVERTSITGSANRILKGSSTEIEDYSFNVFDFIPTEEWDRKQGVMSFIDRQKILIKNVPKDLVTVNVVEHFVVEDPKDINTLFDDLVGRGYEGLIMRYAEDPYIFGRSDKLLKKKSVKECTLICYDVKEGEGKYKGGIGALLCQGTVEGKSIHVSLGSGLSDHDRFVDKEEYINKPIEAIYNSIVRKQSCGPYSLFLPRFKRIAGRI